MKVIVENSTAEIVEKKSRFIANVFYIESADEAEAKLTEIRKKHYDAKHNCFAYILGRNGEVMKSSDDGEPQGTAGHPMLDILKGEELTNCIAIVTRYFGGTLLGTGGLVRAYSDSLKAAIAVSKFSYVYEAYEVGFDIDYDTYGKIENEVQSINQSFTHITGLDKSFEENVRLKYLVNDEVFEKFRLDIGNITKGKVNLSDNNKKTYYICNKKVKYIS